MTIVPPVLALISAVDLSGDGDSIDVGSRLFYALRLIGALAVATLVPILIDRRLRR
jgi:hypothetical protein